VRHARTYGCAVDDGTLLAVDHLMDRRLALLTFVAAACGRDAVSDREHVDPLAPVQAPCEGCTLDVPPRTDPVPLLVVLHGNRETASDAAKRWRSAALARGWAVLALQCPRSLGCDEQARWYKWGGDPRWIFDQIAEVGKQRPLDSARLYIAGWSGGATYIGMMAPHWQRRFAAVVFHGGGQPPTGDDCPRELPAYFLVGNENPAHPAAVRLRDYWRRCGQEHEWDLLDGANHPKEAAALDTSKARSILEWLDRRSRPPLVSAR
jgi:poly(3-hydroxybutyrate) depolymerase